MRQPASPPPSPLPLPPFAHTQPRSPPVQVTRRHCEACTSSLLSVEWKTGHAPAGTDGTFTGCIACDDLLSELCQVCAHAGLRSVRVEGGREDLLAIVRGI